MAIARQRIAARRPAASLAKTAAAQQQFGLQRLAFTLLLLCGLLFFSASALGGETGRSAASVGGGSWSVEQVSGSVAFVSRKASGPASGMVKAGLSFGDPTRIRSGQDGHLVLTNGRDRVILAPGAEIQLVGAARYAGKAVVMQYQGTVRYEVGTRGGSDERAAQSKLGVAPTAAAASGEPFHVVTPYLVASVQGASFDVVVAPDSGSVEVHEGSVEILPREGGDALEIAAGQKAQIIESDESRDVFREARLAGTPATRG